MVVIENVQEYDLFDTPLSHTPNAESFLFMFPTFWYLSGVSPRCLNRNTRIDSIMYVYAKEGILPDKLLFGTRTYMCTLIFNLYSNHFLHRRQTPVLSLHLTRVRSLGIRSSAARHSTILRGVGRAVWGEGSRLVLAKGGCLEAGDVVVAVVVVYSLLSLEHQSAFVAYICILSLQP